MIETVELTKTYGKVRAVDALSFTAPPGRVTAVRRISWLLAGFAAWFILVEGLIGRLDWLLPITAYLKASQAHGDPFDFEVFIAWAVAAVGVAMLTVGADLSGD